MINAQRIEPGLDTEEAITALIDGEPATAALWGMTLAVLGRRAGWALYVGEDGDYGWFFGWEGQGLLSVTVEPFGLNCFHWREDADVTLNSSRELWNWAREREDAEEAAGIKDLMEIRQQLRAAEDERLAAELPE